MRIFLDENVLEAARARVRWVFEEFPKVSVSFSGGKDSTVVLNLALEAAEEMGRLPIPVIFVDQEGEWQSTEAYARKVMYDERVIPYWYQIPIRLFNAFATSRSNDEQWLWCWREGDDWIREKDPIAIHDNDFKTDRFKNLFGEISRRLGGTEKYATLTGMRAHESPARRLAVTNTHVYGGETWGKPQGKKGLHYAFAPIYDWGLRDVWKAIHDHGWEYNTVYDRMYQLGVPFGQMRVSNLHHETAVASMKILQEIEPETWEKITARMESLHVAAHAFSTINCPKELPWMFSGWREYRDHLVKHLVEEEEHREIFMREFAEQDNRYRGAPWAHTDLARKQIDEVMRNDYHMTNMQTWMVANPPHLGRPKGR